MRSTLNNPLVLFLLNMVLGCAPFLSLITSCWSFHVQIHLQVFHVVGDRFVWLYRLPSLGLNPILTLLRLKIWRQTNSWSLTYSYRVIGGIIKASHFWVVLKIKWENSAQHGSCPLQELNGSCEDKPFFSTHFHQATILLLIGLPSDPGSRKRVLTVCKILCTLERSTFPHTLVSLKVISQSFKADLA